LFKLSLYTIYNKYENIMNIDFIKHLSISMDQKLGEIENKNEVKK
jgi:hypothetical protein